MKFGASVWPFHRNPPYDEGLKRIAAIGLNAVENKNSVKKIKKKFGAPSLQWHNTKSRNTKTITEKPNV